MDGVAGGTDTLRSLVQTDMGNAGARAAGMEKAPVSLEDMTSKLLPLVSYTFLFTCLMTLTQP